MAQEPGAVRKEHAQRGVDMSETVVGETVWYCRKDHDEAEVEAWGIYNYSKAIFDAFKRR